MGLLVLTVWMRRWATAALTSFDHTFFAALTPPATIHQSPTQGWLIALESASRQWSNWHY